MPNQTPSANGVSDSVSPTTQDLQVGCFWHQEIKMHFQSLVVFMPNPYEVWTVTATVTVTVTATVTMTLSHREEEVPGQSSCR